MASPFTRYQTEQVPQINILPYTAANAESIRKGIADLGAGIGKGLEGYYQQRQVKEQAASLAQGILNKYIEQDGPEDEATGEVTYKISDTAPSHIKDLYKQVEKQPDGAMGLATTDLNTFLTLEQKHRDEKAVEFEQNYKTQLVEIQKGQADLAKQQLAHTVQVHKDNLALKEKELALATEASERANISAQMEQIKLSKAQAEIELNDAMGYVSPVEMVTQYGVSERRQGVLRSPFFYDEFKVDDIDAFLKESGLKVAKKQAEDSTQQSYAAALAQTLSGDSTFNPALSATENQSTKKRDFVRAVYEQLIKEYPDKKDIIDHKFRWNEKAKGLNVEVELDSKTYDTAMQFFKTDDFQSRVGKRLGVKVKPQTPVVLPNEVEIISEEKVGMGITREVVRFKDSKEMADEAYELTRAKFAEMNAPMPLSKDDAYKIFNIYGGWTEIKLPSGQKALTNGKEMIPLSSGGSISPTAGPKKTEAEMKAQAANNFLSFYQQPTKTTDGKTVAGKRVGNYIIGINATDTTDPLSQMALINPEKAQETVTETEQMLFRSDSYIDKMKSMWGDASWLQAFAVTGSDWNTQYTTLQRGLETFRKSFIAPGTETERDADRLADLMAQPTFTALLFRDPKVMQETLELTRGILHFSAKSKLEGYGFTLNRADGKPMFNNEAEIHDAVMSLVQKYGAKYENKK